MIDPRFDRENADFVVTARGQMSGEGFLDVSGEIGSRAHLLKAIDALLAAADRLWPKPKTRRVVPMAGNREGER